MTETAPSTVGFIGLGIMGWPMAKNVLTAGIPLVVHNRSRAPVDDLVAAGAQAAASPAEVAQQAEILITMLPDPPAVQFVLAGPGGVFEGMRPEAIVIDMSTISPALARDLAQQAAARGATFLDAPVSGGEIGAIAGSLSIMVGGDAAALERARPVLLAMGKRIVHVGASGAGQLCKACNQLVIGVTMAAVGEAFALARRSGVDPARVREALLGGFAASRVLEVHGQRALDGNFIPGAPLRLYHKDLLIVMDTAREHGVPAPFSALVQQFVNGLMAEGRGDEDYARLIAIASRLAGLEE